MFSIATYFCMLQQYFDLDSHAKEFSFVNFE